jgi:hypothetical protein
MGVAVIFGLGFATFLTLVLVPVLYDLLLDFRERWARWRGHGGAGGDEEGGELDGDTAAVGQESEEERRPGVAAREQVATS